MSRWLQNVGQFLEKLDDQAGRVAEERLHQDPDTLDAVPIDSILAARGLDVPADDEEAQVSPEEGWDELELGDVSESPPEATSDNLLAAAEALPDKEEKEGAAAPSTEPEQSDSPEMSDEAMTSELAGETQADTNTGVIADVVESPALPPVQDEAENLDERVVVDAPKEIAAPKERPPPAPMSAPGPLKKLQPTQTPPRRDHDAGALREAQKEARTLRRHVVSLNAQLETAESEIEAQRKELERAAERMHKDIARHKQERESDKSRFAEEIKLLKAQHEQTIKDLKQRGDQQVETVRRQLKDLEERRMQEGGDWNKELADAVQREREMAAAVGALEDDRATLSSQVSTLKVQQEALEHRIESLTSAADSALEREREAEIRLDNSLSLHARQLSQRQAREAELERTVSELGVALVAARNKGAVSRTDQAPGDMTAQDATQDVLLQGMEQDVEALRSLLDTERQRTEALQRELNTMSKERTDEAAIAQMRQQQHDRQVEDLMQTVSQLKTELREHRKGDAGRSLPSDANQENSEEIKQIKRLSEEVMRQREKVSGSNSEISALRSRLKVALDRATKAEAAVERNETEGLLDIERAGGGVRRRRKRTRQDGFSVPMKAAFKVDGVGGEGTERLGQLFDTLDDMMHKGGKILRSNPFARLFFVFYLFFLHFWTTSLLFFHAHNLDTTHCGMIRSNLPIGPETVAKAAGLQDGGGGA